MKVDKRTELSPETLERLLQIAAMVPNFEQLKERERLGVGIEALIKMYDEANAMVVALDDQTKERIAALINNGIFSTQEDVIKEAVGVLFTNKKAEIMQKLDLL